ncbi:ATP-grasp domain-containing protein [Nonomuraea lactucae]|uniref:ATP-grasp domain-containing protein n=1 Tax=Nonomuraea lactucae TaxID=2249762 RepID=UPI0013B3638C|nr:ATP-grasp domain-containing protein [Nonomuraea lactucae]
MSHVLIIEPVSAGALLIDSARKAGHRVTVVTAHRDERFLTEAERSLVDELLLVDENDEENDEESVLAAVLRSHRQLPFDAVIPGFEFFVPLAARIAAELGLPGLQEDSALRLRYKHLMRESLRRAGIRVPRFIVVETSTDLPRLRADAETAAREVALPCVVKPVDLSGSVLVRKASSVAEVRAAVEAIADTTADTLGRPSQRPALVEEYIDGPEYSVEGYISTEGPSIVSVTRKRLGQAPHFVETGHIVQTAASMGHHPDLTGYVEDIIRVLGLRLGVFHAEVRIDARGPVLMEVGARLPGDNICTLLRLAFGVDLPRVFVDCLTGKPPAPYQAAPEPAMAAGVRFVVRPGLTRYTEVRGLDQARRLMGYSSSALLYEPGEAIPQATDSIGRLGWFIFVAPDVEALERTLDTADRLVEFA